MAEYQVTCVTKPDRFNSHEHITHIGGIANSERWRITREDAIAYIESKEHSFYTIDPTSRKKAIIGVRRESGKAPYLQTHADGYWNNNLLSLAECSV